MAALWVSRRRLPGITQRNVLPIAPIPCGGNNRAHRTAPRRHVPGSRLLATYKAAGLQSGLPDIASRSLRRWGEVGSCRRRGEVWLPSRRSIRSIHGVFVTLLSSFLILQALWRFCVTRRPVLDRASSA